MSSTTQPPTATTRLSTPGVERLPDGRGYRMSGPAGCRRCGCAFETLLPAQTYCHGCAARLQASRRRRHRYG